MAGVARIGQDTAGGLIVGPGDRHVLVGRRPAAVVGDAVASHGTGPHAGAAMIRGSLRVTAGGRPLCRAGDTASCGDAATGSDRVTAS